MPILGPPLTVAMAAVVLPGAPGAAHAVSARVDATARQFRDGVPVAAPGAKVSSADLPVQQNVIQSFLPTVPFEGNPGNATDLIAFTGNVTFVADPGDAPTAGLCVRYDFRADNAGSVGALDASIAGGVASSNGFSVDANVSPVTVTAPNPAQLILTPAVGPVQALFSGGPETFSRNVLGANAASLNRQGSFVARAGDVVTWAFESGVGARAELPAGQSAISANRMSFTISAGCGVAAVPSVSGPPSRSFPH